jgi:carboxyl-terminal processing protease
MNPLEVLIIAADVLALLGPLVPRLSRARWLDFVPIGAVMIAIAHLVLEGFRPIMIPVYLITGLLFGRSLWRIVRPVSAEGPRRLRRMLSLTSRVLGVLLLSIPVIFSPLVPAPANYSRMSWSAAFDAMHAEVSREYPFGEWKGIDWKALHAEYAPRIAAAQASHDTRAYYLALRGYIYSVPDGHVWLEGDDLGSRKDAIGGGYGLNVIGLDDGRVIASQVQPDGPAARAGLEWGAEILEWNGQPIEAALDQVSTLWARGSPATAEAHRIEQYRFLVRAPVGDEARITFRNPGDAKARTVTLTATDDQLEMLQRTYLNPEFQPSQTPIRSKILPSGHGYIKIDAEFSTRSGYDPEAAMRQAVEEFKARQVPGVILDVRGNGGGADDWVPKIVGFFFSEPSHYEYRAYYTQGIDQYVVLPPLTLSIEPLKPHYAGPVIVLVDSETMSSGEGIPMSIQRLPQGQVMGFWGTYGSFGMSGGELYLPDGYTLHYPIGRSLDAEYQIQLDSDEDLRGGVPPDIRVPWTEETVRKTFVERQDVLLDSAIQFLQSQ